MKVSWSSKPVLLRKWTSVFHLRTDTPPGNLPKGLLRELKCGTKGVIQMKLRRADIVALIKKIS